MKKWLVYGETMPEGVYDCEELPPNASVLTREQLIEFAQAVEHITDMYDGTNQADLKELLNKLFGKESE